MIELHRIQKTYGSFTALRDVELAIDAAQFVAVVGKSGSGKSTLLNLIAGIDVPTSGTVTVGGTSLAGLGANALAAWRGRNVGFVFQFFQLLPTLTAIENVILPMDFCRTVPPRERHARALSLLERVGVANQADKFPSALSGGQQQRVAIARALANEPRVILADEPTGNLDTATAASVLELFRTIANGGTTVVIATHERDIAHLIHRKIELVDGRVA